MEDSAVISDEAKRDLYIRFARKLYKECRSQGAPENLMAYHGSCKIGEIAIRKMVGNGCIRWLSREKLFRIEVNESLPNEVRRFVWAHEIGHTFPYVLASHQHPTTGPERILDEGHRADDVDERLFDEVAGELLIPHEVLLPLTRDLAPSLQAVCDIARRYRTTVKTAAMRFVQTVEIRCMLLSWEIQNSNPLTLRPYILVEGPDVKWTARIPSLTDSSAQPIVALETGQLQIGRSWIDLGGGIESYYCESLPSRSRDKRSVIMLVVLDRNTPLYLRRPAKLPSVQRKLFELE